MKIPKLKYYYYAMNPEEYAGFESTRQLRVNEPATVNIATGKITESKPFLYLYSKPAVADTRYRQLSAWQDSVYVLRIPAALVPRRLLEATEDPAGMWLCRANIAIAHCGVERFEQDPSVPTVQAEVVASSSPRRNNRQVGSSAK